MRASRKVLVISVALAVSAFGLAAAEVLVPGGSAGATGPDVIQYAQQSGSNGTYIKYVPGDGSAPTTQSITSGGGGCSTPMPSGTPILNFSGAYYANNAYGLPATPAPVGAYKQRTGICQYGQAWSLEPAEALTFSVGTHSLVQGRLFTRADIALQNQDKSGSATGRVQLIEYRAGTQVATQTITIPALQGMGFIGSTGSVLTGFDSIQIRVVPPSASSASVSVVGPTSTFTFGAPVLTLTKSDNLGGATYDHVGQSVGYTLTATNAGTTTLHNVTVSDTPALAGFSCSPTVPAASIAPGASIACTGTHTVTQADLDAGSYSDTGSASSTETPTVTASDTVTGTQNKSLTLTKVDDLGGGTYSQPGQAVTYTLTATNAGNITLHNVRVSDTPALAGFSCSPTVPAASLAPNAQVVCTGTHTITLADLSATSFSDTASALSNETPTPTTASDTVYAATQQLCGGQTISTQSSASAGAVKADMTLNGSVSDCKDYTYFAAANGDPNTNQPATVTFLSQQVATAHVTANFVWGYDTYCTPDGANNTATCPATTYDLGSGPQPQTFCAAADPDPNVGRLWCTTSRSYKYVTDVSTGQVVTQITETWDGYGDLTMRH